MQITISINANDRVINHNSMKSFVFHSEKYPELSFIIFIGTKHLYFQITKGKRALQDLFEEFNMQVTFQKDVTTNNAINNFSTS